MKTVGVQHGQLDRHGHARTGVGSVLLNSRIIRMTCSQDGGVQGKCQAPIVNQFLRMNKTKMVVNNNLVNRSLQSKGKKVTSDSTNVIFG